MTAFRTDRSLVLVAAAALGTTLLAAVGVHWVVTLVALGAISILAAVNPAVVVAAVVLSIPVQSALDIPFVRGELTLTQLVLFGLIAGWGALFWRRRIWFDSIVVGFLLVLAAYVVSFIAVDSPGLWFQETYRWAVAGIFYIICRSIISSWQHVRWILWAITTGVIGVSIYAAWQIVVGAAPVDFQVGGAVRVYATFGTPNTLAAYLEMTIPVLLACLPIAWWGSDTDQFSIYEKWLFTIVPLGGLLVIGLTQSRGGWIGVAAACIVLWLQLPGRTRAITALVSVVVLSGFLLTAPGQSQLKRFGDLREETYTESEIEIDSRSSYEVGVGRGALWATARVMIADKPLTGVGAGEFDENYREYVPSWIDRFPRGQAHNVWLQMGAQAGIWGIIGYTWWFAASVWSVITARRRVDSRTHFWLITGVLAVFAAYTFHSLVDYLNVLSLGLQLSVLTAIALNMAPEPLTRYGSQPTQHKSVISPETAPCPQ